MGAGREFELRQRSNTNAKDSLASRKQVMSWIGVVCGAVRWGEVGGGVASVVGWAVVVDYHCDGTSEACAAIVCSIMLSRLAVQQTFHATCFVLWVYTCSDRRSDQRLQKAPLYCRTCYDRTLSQALEGYREMLHIVIKIMMDERRAYIKDLFKQVY